MGHVYVKVVREGGKLEQATSGSSGYDLVSCLAGENELFPGASILVPCGISLEMTADLEAQVRPRSGLALRHGVTLLNSPGTIDSDYRGEVHALLINLGQTVWTFRRGDRIAQLVFGRVHHPTLEYVEELRDSERGHGGFGSTGV